MSTALATTDVILSASNTAEIHKQKKNDCLVFLDNFDYKNSTEQENQQYTECLQVLHPNPMSYEEVVAIKVCIVAVLFSMIVGAIYGKTKSWDRSWESCIMWTLAAPFIVAGVVLFLGGVIAAIMFLFI